MTVVPTICCKARDLTDTLAESIRVAIHQQLDDLIAGSQRCPYVLTEAGEDIARRHEQEILDLIK